ncbi:MAG: hypothetical protein KGO82_07115 [Bacteroidota bacterium]|nr:hypothetical protein [Bacteroidota bacterium]
MFLPFTTGIADSINNFLKNEAEILADFNGHLQRSVQDMDRLQQSAYLSYDRIVESLQRVNDPGADFNFYMEENY